MAEERDRGYRCARCAKCKPDVARDEEWGLYLCNRCWVDSRPVTFRRRNGWTAPAPEPHQDEE